MLAVRVTLAVLNGIGSGWNMWCRLNGAGKRARRTHAYASAISWLLIGLRRARLLDVQSEPNPPFDLRSRARMVAASLGWFALVAFAALICFPVPDKKRTRHERAEPGRRLARLVQRRNKRRSMLSVAPGWKVWRRSVTPALRGPDRPPLVTAVATGLANTVSVWDARRPAGTKLPASTYMTTAITLAEAIARAAGILPSSVWIPQRIRIVGRTTFVVLALLVTLPLSLYRLWMIRLAVSPEKNLQAHYERMGRLRQQMQTRQRELGENPPDHG